jgi:hypothetical protein
VANVPPAHKAHTVILNNYSYMPIALHILWQERVWMDIMGRILLDSDVLVRGCIVDNFFCERPLELCDKCEAAKAGRPYRTDEMPDECLNCELRKALPIAALEYRKPGKLTYARALFKLGEDSVEKVPVCVQSYDDNDRRGDQPEPMQWITVAETDTGTIHRLMPNAVRPAAALALGSIMAKVNEFIPDVSQLDDVAMLAAQNGGCFVDAGPGTGKTRAFLPKLMGAWKNLNPDVVFVKVAPTYVAAKQMRGGITCQAAVQRNVHNRFQVQVMVVDEVSMVSTNLLERMARWSIMGLKFVLLGDFSQLLPVGVDGNTRWRVEDSRTFMKLAGNLRIVLNQNRRAAADPEHFKRIMALRPMVDEPMDHIVPAFMQHYPWTGPATQPIAYYICLSHRTRMRINRWQNVLEMNRQDRVLLVPSYGFQKGCSSQPQDMWIWPGLHLIGGGRTSRNVLNGVVYIVVNFTDEAITVKTHPDFTTDPEATIELPIREAAENLRLCYAAV